MAFDARQTAVAFVLWAILGSPAFAQQPAATAANDVSAPPVFLVGAGWGRLTHATVDGGILFPVGKEVERGEAVGRHGIEVLGSGENGGFQLAGGWGGVVREETRIVVLGWELLGTVGSSVVRAA